MSTSLPPLTAYDALVRDCLKRHEESYVQLSIENPAVILQTAFDSIELLGRMKAATHLADRKAALQSLRAMLQLFRDYYGRHLILFCEHQGIDSEPFRCLMADPRADAFPKAETLLERILAIGTLELAKHELAAKRKAEQRRRRKRDPKSRPLTAKQTEAAQLVGEHKGNFTAAAAAAGISRQAMKKRYKQAMKKLGKSAGKQQIKTRRLPTDSRGQETISDDEE